MKLFGEILLVSEIINLVLAILTTIAVIWAICLYFLQRRDARKKAKQEEREEKIAVLITLHQHFLVCYERLKDFSENFLPKKKVPYFRLPTMAIERTFEIAARRLRDNPKLLRMLLKSFEKHTHMNALLDEFRSVTYAPPKDQMGLQGAIVTTLREVEKKCNQETIDCIRELKKHIEKIRTENTT